MYCHFGLDCIFVLYFDMSTGSPLNVSDKFLFRFVTGISIFVFVVVLLLNKRMIPVTIETPSFVFFLPKLNAILNGTCAFLLMVSLYFIKQKNIEMHKKVNLLAFIISAVFLVSYILFHYFVKETSFGGEGSIRYVYYLILITHIVLAAIVLPLVLLSFHRGLQMDVARHRKLVRFAYPIWLYVTISGVIVYLMISPYYQF
jgi:putative membrane protein